MRGYRWVVLAVIILASFVAYTLRTNVNIVGESMMRDLGMTEYQLGLVFSAFAAGYAIFQFPGGLIGDRFGPRKTITAIAIAWSLLTVITALIPGSGVWTVGYTVGALILTRFLVGVSNGPFFPVTIGGTIERWFPVSQWGLPNGLSSAGLTQISSQNHARRAGLHPLRPASCRSRHRKGCMEAGAERQERTSHCAQLLLHELCLLPVLQLVLLLPR